MVQWNHLCKNLTSQHFQVLLLTWPSVVLHCSREVKPEIDMVAHRYLKSTRLKREEWRCSDKLIDHWGSLDLFFFLKRDAQLTSLLPGCRITVTMKATKWMRPLYTSSRWYLWRHVHIQPMRSEEKQVSRLVVLTLTRAHCVCDRSSSHSIVIIRRWVLALRSISWCYSSLLSSATDVSCGRFILRVPLGPLASDQIFISFT